MAPALEPEGFDASRDRFDFRRAVQTIFWREIMSKIMLKCFTVAFALGIFPAAAFAEDASQSPPPAPYDGPLPAGGAMTREAAAAWYGDGRIIEIGVGVLLVGGLLVALSNSNGNSTPSATTTHSP
jgi:hypothetical protein